MKTKITVGDLIAFLSALVKEGKLKPSAKIVLSSDEEGNEHSYMKGYDLLGRDIILIPSHDRIDLPVGL